MKCQDNFSLINKCHADITKYMLGDKLITHSFKVDLKNELQLFTCCGWNDQILQLKFAF